MKRPRQLVLGALATLVFSSVAQAQTSNQSQPLTAPVFTIEPVQSSVRFYVKSSVKLEGTFEKWDATLVFTSTDASTGVLNIKLRADSVTTGNRSQDEMLKGENCFDVARNPYITFHSTKITRTAANNFDVAGIFTLRGISKPASLTLTVDREAGGTTGEIKGLLTFNRADFGLSGGIPFVTIANRVDVRIKLKATRVGPPLVFKQ